MKTPRFLCLTLLTAALSFGGCATPAGKIETNKAVARKVFEEVLGQGRIDENEHLYSPKFAAHSITQSAGRAEDREATKGWRTAFPDLKMSVTHVVAEGDFVTVRFIARGHNTGQGNGMPGNGKFVQITGIAIFRLENGQITDEWSDFDELGLSRQLGLLSAGN
ncbi:MAG: ester cyclase [Opitutae bacterium]|nr:ester cyclase [Opitutae bacterium]